MHVKRRPPSPGVYYAVLAVVYTLVAIYGSVVPLGDVPAQGPAVTPPPGASGDLSLTDVAANVALFVPLGFLWSGSLLFSGSFRIRLLRSIAVVGALALASAAIENTQRWLATRTVSAADVAAETLGAALGCFLWWRFGPRLTIWLAARQKPRLADQWRDWFLQAYFVIATFLWLLPFDLSARPTELIGKYRARLVALNPFFDLPAERLFRVGLVFVGFAPVGVLLATSHTRDANRARTDQECRWPIIALTGSLALGQMMVISRRSDILEIAALALALCCGTGLARAWMSDPHPSVWSQTGDWLRRLGVGWNESIAAQPHYRWMCAYRTAVALAIGWTLWQANIMVPGSLGITGWQAPDWRPTWPYPLFWTACVASLVLVPRVPALAPLVFTAIAYGLAPRTHPAGEFVRALGLLEIVLLLGWLGVWLSPLQAKLKRLRRSPAFFIGLAYVGWSLVCVLVMLSEGRPWTEEVLKQCVRLLDCVAVLGLAAVTLSTRAASLAMLLTTTFGVLLTGVIAPEDLYRNHITASTVALVLPLAFEGLFAVRVFFAQIMIALSLLNLGGMLYAGQSRSALIGALSGLVVWIVLSPRRWWLVILGVPAALIAWQGAENSLLAARFRALFAREPGWDTGRIELWEYAWSTFRQHPLAGLGPGTGYKAFSDVHSSYLSVLSETGSIGLLLYALFWLAILGRLAYDMTKQPTTWRSGLAKAVGAATIAHLVIGFGYSLHALQLAFLFAGWSMAMAGPRDSQNGQLELQR